MSTRSSLYYHDLPREVACPHAEKGIHVYKEMHDDCIHLSLYRANSEVNVILAPEHWEILTAVLVPEPPETP
mgnify:CR=1 FL=1